MRVALIFEETIQAGGGFSQALNAILQFRNISKGNFEWFVLSQHRANCEILQRMGIEVHKFAPRLMDKLISWIFLSHHTRVLFRKLKLKTSFEKKLIQLNCDLVYFLAPSARIQYIQNLNFIATIWDNCHRDFPEFPEASKDSEFMRREAIFRELPRATLTLVDSETLASRLFERYGLDRNRMLVMPFSPNALVNMPTPENQAKILSIYELTAGYFFYPAQFWPHKNHIRILEALHLMNEKGKAGQVVFVGSDKGAGPNVERKIKQYGLEKKVVNLGFIPVEHMGALYSGCIAVIMPTYFGPTNIPPLEAWQFDRPLIYSEHLSDQCGDAALLIDPDSAESLASAMESIMSRSLSNDIVNKGRLRLAAIAEKRQIAECVFLEKLLLHKQRLKTWNAKG